MSPDEIKLQLCQDDFWQMLRAALVQAHGNPNSVERYAEMPLKQCVEELAQNGLRMVYLPESHMEHVRQHAIESKEILLLESEEVHEV